jgi:hypothetical protein
MRATVTFETVTEQSAIDGATDDNGWIAPNECRVSLGLARNYGKRLRMAQRGRYDWTDLGDAVRFILGKAQYVRSEVDVDVHTWEPGRSWVVRVECERTQEDEATAESVGYSLRVAGLSKGSAERLERLFIDAGCRRPHARAASFRKVG